MRFMVILKATKASEAGEMPSEALMTAMIKFNEELVKAGVLLAADGLRPSRDGARVRFDGNRREVIDGPFAETRELVAGYWMIQVSSLAEAIEWMKRAPHPMEGDVAELEIRRMFEADDFGDELTPEARATIDRMHAEVAAKS
ncbi:MAG TPA: YciI family protein [Luteibacter sp.]|uniref:YciI family protein n=1 Tax=Luteibacter sp. TaxID=1886636 RepID=UPI002B76DFFF|nr:YciI family protein [Luteibacter sp.]HVI56698.1 YciI family protein [Luteibacter sp.]